MKLVGRRTFPKGEPFHDPLQTEERRTGVHRRGGRGGAKRDRRAPCPAPLMQYPEPYMMPHLVKGKCSKLLLT